MTGLERLVHTVFGANKETGRYLILLYGITLWLSLVLALIAIYQNVKITPDEAPVITTQAVLSPTATPYPRSTQAQGRNTPTSLPAIPSTPNEKTPSYLGVTTDELRGVHVNIWHPWTGATEVVLEDLLDEFNRTNLWGITVEASSHDGFGRLDEAVETALLANVQPDVIVDYGYQAAHWDGVEALVDMTPYTNDPVWGMTADEQADFFPSFWVEDLVRASSSGQSRRLGIPFSRSAYVFFYNQSWAHELGYPNVPKTPEDFRVRACAAAQFVREQGDKSSLGKGGWLITPQPGLLAGWIYAFGGNITHPEEQGYLFNTPETRQAFEYLKSLQNNDCAWLDSAVDSQSEFASRGALFIVGSLFDIPAQQAAFTQAGNLDEWVVLPFPSSDQPVVDTYGPSLLMTRSNPTQQLAAWLVIQWLVYPPNQSEWVKILEVYPTRQSTLGYLAEVADDNTQWAEALELLLGARSEPSLASWKVMRWALEDVITELFDPQFSADEIPVMLKELDRLADEIYTQVY
jgi:multiple sugar transport system substrate-binding protein/sn-glycerol 3-phosphate transport system substrate-binding protein